MKYVCRVSEKGGVWTAEHSSPDIGPVRATGATRAEALEKIEGEIRYCLEMCPCTGETYRNLTIEAVEAG